MSGKKYQQLQESMPKEAVDSKTATAWIKEHVKGGFDQTVELHIHLGVDATRSDQMVKGNVTLPHGTPKQKKVVVITSDAKKQTAAKEAGAFLVGAENIIEKILADKGIDADLVVVTPDMMPKLAKTAKILGPKGLMPNPKNGTVTPDVVKAVSELMAGKITFKMDQSGNVHEAVGKVSWEAAKTADNIDAFISAVRAVKPAGQKGEYLKKVIVKGTMSPGLKLTV